MSSIFSMMAAIKQSIVAAYAGLFTKRTVTTGSWNLAVYANSKFTVYYGAGTPTTTVPYSTNGGVTWQNGTANIQMTVGTGIATDGTRIVICKNGTTTIPAMYYSDDGFNWTPTAYIVVNTASIAYGNGIWVTLTSNTGKALTSTDGANWTLSAVVLPVKSWNRIVFANGIFMAVSSVSSVTSVATSTNGLTWTVQTLPAAFAPTQMVYGNGLWVMTQAASATYYYSSDNGVSWTATSLPTSVTVRGSFFMNGNFILPTVGTVGFYVSSTGIGGWTLKAVPTVSVSSPYYCATDGVSGVIPCGGTVPYVVQAT